MSQQSLIGRLQDTSKEPLVSKWVTVDRPYTNLEEVLGTPNNIKKVFPTRYFSFSCTPNDDIQSNVKMIQ